MFSGTWRNGIARRLRTAELRVRFPSFSSIHAGDCGPKGRRDTEMQVLPLALNAGDVCPRVEHLEVRALPPASWWGSLNAKALPSWRDGGSRPSPATILCQSSSAGSGWTQYSAQDSRDLGQSNPYLTGRSGVRFPPLACWYMRVGRLLRGPKGGAVVASRFLRGSSSVRSERIGKSVGREPKGRWFKSILPHLQRSSGRVTEGGSLEVRTLPAALRQRPCAHTEGTERSWFESILPR